MPEDTRPVTCSESLFGISNSIPSSPRLKTTGNTTTPCLMSYRCTKVISGMKGWGKYVRLPPGFCVPISLSRQQPARMNGLVTVFTLFTCSDKPPALPTVFEDLMDLTNPRVGRREVASSPSVTFVPWSRYGAPCSM